MTREEFEELAGPLLAETVQLTAQAAGHAGLPAERIAGVFLVGGASRIPLVGTLVHQGAGASGTSSSAPAGAPPTRLRIASIGVDTPLEDPGLDTYAPTPNAQLRLITCGGRFDRARGSYVDNVVVDAVLVSG